MPLKDIRKGGWNLLPLKKRDTMETENPSERGVLKSPIGIEIKTMSVKKYVTHPYAKRSSLPMAEGAPVAVNLSFYSWSLTMLGTMAARIEKNWEGAQRCFIYGLKKEDGRKMGFSFFAPTAIKESKGMEVYVRTN